MNWPKLLRNVGLTVLALVTVGLFWQHIARVNKVEYWKPSTLGNFVADQTKIICDEIIKQVQSGWKALGEFVSWLSGFLHFIWPYIKLDEFYEAIVEFFSPIGRMFCTLGFFLWDLFWSWTYFFAGYIEYFNDYTHKWLYPIGSAMIIGAMVLVCMYTSICTKIYNKLVCQCCERGFRRVKGLFVHQAQA